MNEREVDIDALFERDADARLLERRRREELGLAPLAAVATTTPIQFGPESMVDGEPAPFVRGALLRVAVDARPTAELIPGALVAVVVTVHDEGDVDAPDAKLRVVLPADAEAVDGSFLRDGVAIDGTALTGEGLRLGPVPAGEAIRVNVSLRILPGTEALDLFAEVSCPGVPSIAAPALRLTRRSGHAAVSPPKPFFELEEDEEPLDLFEPAADAFVAERIVIDTISAAPAMPPLPEPDAVPQDAEPEPESARRPERTAPVAEPELVAEPEPVLEPAAVVEPEAIAEPAGVVEPETAEPEAVAGTEAAAGPDAVAETEAAAEPEAVSEPEAFGEPPAEEPPIAPPPLPRAVFFSGPRVTIGPPPTPSPAEPPREPVEPARIEAARRRERDELLARAIEADEVRALQRVFTGAVPHGLAALALLSSIA